LPGGVFRLKKKSEVAGAFKGVGCQGRYFKKNTKQIASFLAKKIRSTGRGKSLVGKNGCP